jgi:hypothetical protein
MVNQAIIKARVEICQTPISFISSSPIIFYLCSASQSIIAFQIFSVSNYISLLSTVLTMRVSITVIHFLLSVVLASPLPQTSRRAICTQSFNANYDNIETSAIALLNETPSPYDMLGLLGFFTVPPATDNAIVSHSAPNSIGFNLVGTLDSGSIPTFTVDYTGSVITSFTLYSTYIGCVVVNPVGIYEPQSCSVVATGTTTTGAVVTQNLDFTVPFPVLPQDFPVQQQLVEFGSDFTNLTTVTYVVAAAGVAVPVTGVSFDNVVYDVSYPC